MKLDIRPERPEDYRAVEEMTRAAFMAPGSPGYDYEHYLLHVIRQKPSFVPELDFVAEEGGRMAGNVVYSRAQLVDGARAAHQVLTFGPLSVHPAYQCRGVGRALMEHSIAAAKHLGFRAIVFFGHPDYYPRLDFERGANTASPRRAAPPSTR